MRGRQENRAQELRRGCETDEEQPVSRQDGIKARRKASDVYKSDNMTVITHGPV